MITHEAPGDTFWDRIRAGAEQAAKDTGSTLKYSADPEATKQAVLIQGAIDSKVDGIATTLVTPDALIPTVKKAVAAGIPVDSFNSGTNFYQQAGSIAHFSSDEKLAGQQAGEKAKADGATKILCTIQQTGSVALGGSLCRRQERLPEHREHPGQRPGRLRGHLGDPGQAGPGQGHQLDHHPRCGSGVGRSQGHGCGEERGQDRHLRSEQGGGGGGEGREDPVLHRPAAVPAGLPGGHPALPLQEERQHPRRRPAVADRPVVRRQDQRRRHPAVHQPKHPLVPRLRGLALAPAPWPTTRT